MRLQPHAQNAAGGGAKAIVGGLAVDEEADALWWAPVGDPRAVAAALLADDEQQAEAGFAGGAEPFSGTNLGSHDTFGIARAASEDEAALHAARKERRHAVEVCGEHHMRGGGARLREDVEAAVGDRLLSD